MKHKVAAIINRMPTYIREDYPKFVKLMTAYYEWLLTEDGNASDIMAHSDVLDIDGSELSLHIIKDLGLEGCPASVVRPMISFAREFNSSRGSAKSFTDYFRIYFSKRVEVRDNAEALFIPSDARYEKYSRCVVLVGRGSTVPDSGVLSQAFAGGNGDVVAANHIYSIPTGDIYEVMVKSPRRFYTGQPLVITGQGLVVPATPINLFTPVFAFSQNFRRGDIVTVETDIMSFILKVKGIRAVGLSELVITTPGLGYRIGDAVLVAGQYSGSGFSAQVTKIGVSGQVLEVDILSAGYGYDTTPVLRVKSRHGVGAVINVTSPCGAIYEMSMSSRPYGTTATATTYSQDGTTPACMFEETMFEEVVIRTTSNGVIGEGTVITDSLAWQYNAYTVETDAEREEWEVMVKSGLHPAGRYMHVVKLQQAADVSLGGISSLTSIALRYAPLDLSFATGEGMDFDLKTFSNFSLRFSDGSVNSVYIANNQHLAANMSEGSSSQSRLT